MKVQDSGLGTRWPPHLRPGALRWVRASGHYDETIAFYRDVIGLAVVGQFAASFGEDGTIFGLPDTSSQMEIVRARESHPAGDFDQLVLYLADADAVATATVPLRAAGLEPVAAHPYWQANGAVVYRDPDGRAVVFAPWVYGQEPDPIDRDAGAGAPASESPSIDVEWYVGDRESLRWSFELAEDSARQLDVYLGQGRVLVARRGSDLVGHLQLVPTGEEGEAEVKNMAVLPDLRGTGVGRLLVEAAVDACRAEGVVRLVVATGAADTGNLRFYQRCGFRFDAVERDAFTPATGYPEFIVIEGVPLLDRVWFARDLSESGSG